MNEKLHEYAALLIRIGLNIQKGQRLVISSPVECAYFARLCAEEAYAAGCREVVMNWHDDAMARLKYLHADDEIFDTVPLWRRHFFNDHALEGAAYLAISLGLIPLMYLTVALERTPATYITCVVYLSVVVSHGADQAPVAFALGRVVDTLLGIFLSLGVNALPLGRRKSHRN